MMLLVPEPGGGRLFVFVNDLSGPLYSVSEDGRDVVPYLDLGSPRWGLDFFNEGSQGFQSFAFHPQVQHPEHARLRQVLHPLLYRRRRAGIGPRSRGRQARFSPAGMDGSRPRCRGAMTAAPRANCCGGENLQYLLAFSSFAQPGDLDYGMLYVAASDPHGKSRKLVSILGKILRINPWAPTAPTAGTASRRTIRSPPTATPPTSAKSGRPVCASPRGSPGAPANGRLFVADIGEDSVEEISLVTRGADLGWQDWGGSVGRSRTNTA